MSDVSRGRGVEIGPGEDEIFIGRIKLWIQARQAIYATWTSWSLEITVAEALCDPAGPEPRRGGSSFFSDEHRGKARLDELM